MHEIVVNRLGGLSLPRKSVVRLTDRPDMTLDVYRGRKTTTQQINLFVPGYPIKETLANSVRPDQMPQTWHLIRVCTIWLNIHFSR